MFFSVYRSSAMNPLSYIRLFTHILGHINYQHFIGNFTIILLIGPSVEEKYGSRNLLLMIMVTAFTTGIFHIIISPTSVLLGASGIVYMLIILSSLVNFEKGRIPITFVFIIFMFMGQEFIGVIQHNDDISHISHVLGGLCGAAIGFNMNSKLSK